MSFEEAQDIIKQNFNIPQEIDLTTYDALEAITQGDPNGIAVFAQQAQIQNTIVGITNAIDSSPESRLATSDLVLQNFTQSLNSGSNVVFHDNGSSSLDLSNPDRIDQLFPNTSNSDSNTSVNADLDNIHRYCTKNRNQ